MKEEIYNTLNDEQLIEKAKNGDTLSLDFIMNKYKNMVKSKARMYFLMGADREDIIQEGMIGLYKAVRDFQPQRGIAFKKFAEICVNRKMISAIKAASRQKHIPLNSSVSLNKKVYEDDEEETFMDFIEPDEETSPEAIFIGIENKKVMTEYLAKELSKFESRVLSLYLQGKNYSTISEITGKPEKSIDNALQRVKKKTEKFMQKPDN